MNKITKILPDFASGFCCDLVSKRHDGHQLHSLRSDKETIHSVVIGVCDPERPYHHIPSRESHIPHSSCPDAGQHIQYCQDPVFDNLCLVERFFDYLPYLFF